MTRTRQWAILTTLAVAVVAVVGWFALIRPTHSHAATLRGQVVDQQQANQLLQSEIASLRAQQKHLPAQQRALRRFATKLPIGAGEPTMVRELTTAAAAAGVELVSITPGTGAPLSVAGATTAGPPAKGPQVMQLPVALGVDGSFANLESFFQQLESLPRALTVTGWTMCPSAGSGGAGCSAPALPANKTAPKGELGGTLSTLAYYVVPGAQASGAVSSGTTAGTTSGSTASPSPSPSASPAAPSS
ncbi:MAG TPA: type 4a pilus biogenesis protein PilO [Mycobacteriales bacterium]|nr:type 4a pilus biogenesis protein PilO [Mycobacteriales bacterium]